MSSSKEEKFTAQMGKGHLALRRVTMEGFLRYLYFAPGFAQQILDRPVVDKTGLTSYFDVTLEWAPDNGPDSGGPSIFAAIEEQAGLKLEPHKSPTEFLVIDHFEKPGEN